MPRPPKIKTILLDPSVHKPLIYPIVSIHQSCILEDHTIATFLPPLDQADMFNWWLDRFQEAERGQIFIVGGFVAKDEEEEEEEEEEKGVAEGKEGDENQIDLTKYHLASLAYLSPSPTPTGPFRASILKLLTSPSHRRLGLARHILSHLERLAAAHGYTRLLLDTEADTPAAEHVYPRLGWTRIGVVPADAISPRDGALRDTVVFCKLLEGHGHGKEIWGKRDLAMR